MICTEQNLAKKLLLSECRILTGCHPECTKTSSPGKSIADWHKCNKFVYPIDKQREEGESNEPSQLVVVRIRNEPKSRYQDNGKHQKRSRGRDCREGTESKDEPGEALKEGHLSTYLAKGKEVELV